MRLQALLLLCFAILHPTFAEYECYIDVQDGIHPVSPPLMIIASDPPQHIRPTVDHPAGLTFRKGETLLVVCPRFPNMSKNDKTVVGSIMADKQPIKSFNATVECMKNEDFLIEGKKISFAKIFCGTKPQENPSAILRKAQRCENGVRYEIGYDLGGFGFLKTIELCHEAVKARTLWAHAIIQPANTRSSYHGCNTIFEPGFLYEGMIMKSDHPYVLKKAFEMYVQLLGRNVSKRYFAEEITEGRRKRNYLARGHLIARADMMFQREQRSTYFYSNAVPMWQKINAKGGNWYFVEDYIRRQAKNLTHQLNVYAGGLRTLQINGKFIYLYKGKKIPAPEVLFKCMLDHQDKTGLCFLVVNNPYIDKDKVEDYVICQRSDACDQHSKKFEKAEVGYTYCCSLNNFYRATSGEMGDELEPFRNYSEMRLH